MELTRFDALARRWADAGTRRRFLGMLAGVGAASVAVLPELGESPDAEGKAKRVRGEHNVRGKKAIMCIDGKTRRVPKKKRKAWLKRGATRGACTGCTPTCPANGCGMDDGCGNVCGCGDGTMCAAGACMACDVTCTGDAEACGAALQTALDAGGDVYICPGRYATVDGFMTPKGTGANLYGAGSGDDPASNTILDAAGNPVTVLTIPGVSDGSTVTLSGLRITGGNSPLAGGIQNSNAVITIENCAIVGNIGDGSTAGGVYTQGALTMVNSLVEGNTCSDEGPGGIHVRHTGYGTVSTITNSVITGNEGGAVGGIYVQLFNDDQSLTVDSTSQITNNSAKSVADFAGGIGADPMFGTVDVTGATITGNTDPQCMYAIGCP